MISFEARVLDEVECDLLKELDEAERKAWDSLARYKFMQFGYWAAIWVHLNRIGHFNRPNPWRDLVHFARTRNCNEETK